MDIREVQKLEGVKIVDPRSSRSRQLLVGALTVVAIGVLGWVLFGRTAPKPTAAAPSAAPAAGTAVAAADGSARQATGSIAEGGAKPLPTIRLATPEQAPSAPSPAAGSGTDPAQSPPANPQPSSNSSPSPSPSPSLTASTSAGARPTSVPALKLDTEFASAKRIVPFAFNRVGVGPQGRLAVRELVPLAKQADKVNVRGRTDGLGNAQSNRKVALARARTVYNAFVDEGVDQRKMRLAYCTTCFVAMNDTEAGRRLNRRVEVELIMPHSEIAKLPRPIHAPESLPPLAPLAASGTLHGLPR